MKLGIGNHATDTELRVQDMTFGEFADKLSRPKIGPKDGLYVVRGGLLKEPKRADANLIEAELIVVDGDSRFDPETGEIESGAPDFDVACEAFKSLGVPFVLHTTHSNQPGKPKWRGYIPAVMSSPAELSACVGAVIEHLNGAGCFVVQSKECTTWSQAWFTPRVPSPEALEWFRFHAATEGNSFNVAAAVAVAQRQAITEEAVERVQNAPKPTPNVNGPSPIEAFNASATIETVRYMLEQAGYKLAYRRGDTLRMIAPGSETGTAGVHVFKGRQRGDIVAYSHHGAHDPLSGRLNDAFGVLTRVRHKGDQDAAIDEAKAVVGWASRRDPTEGFEVIAEDFRDAPKTSASSGPLFIRADAFAAGWKPAEYLVDGLIQRGYCYSLTSPTGHGKTALVMLLAACIGTAEAFAGAETLPGRVGYFAAENPNDVQARWIGMQETMGFTDASVWFCPETINIANSYDRITAEADRLGGFDLIVVDTSQAFFLGEDENSNAQMVGHAKAMRKLTTLPGNPCVIILTHPVKNPSKDNLLPRGGGGFLAEVDGNLSLWNDDSNLTLHHQGKFRGAGFAPINFTLRNVSPARLKDAKGRQIPTVVAEHITEEQFNTRLMDNASDQDRVMIILLSRRGKVSTSEIASTLNWLTSSGLPNRMKVSRLLTQLRNEKLVVKRRNGQYKLTPAGSKEIGPKAKAMGVDAVEDDEEDGEEDIENTEF